MLVSTHDLDVAAREFRRIMLLNRKLVAFGPASAVMRTELLLPTFGGHASVQLPPAENGGTAGVVVFDTCCDGGDAHHAHGPGAHAEGDRAEIPASAGTESSSDR